MALLPFREKQAPPSERCAPARARASPFGEELVRSKVDPIVVAEVAAIARPPGAIELDEGNSTRGDEAGGTPRNPNQKPRSGRELDACATTAREPTRNAARSNTT